MKFPFRSLYLKIFIWFWLAMIIINVVLFAAFALTRPTPTRRSWRDLAQTGANSQKAAEIYEQSGSGALSAALQATEKASGVSATFFDVTGQELSGRFAPQKAQELSAKAAETRDIEFNFDVEGTLVARPVVSPKGQLYIYVAHIPRPPFQPTFQTLGLRLLVVLVIGGIFCYWLARYLTTPIFKLRTTTNELAEGNLGARVATKLVKRRDEVGQLGRDFNVMAERLESMVKAQQRLLGDISHELRSPLARLGVALGLARQRSGAEANGALDRIERESENLNEMISQLLTLTRLESGTDGRKRTEVDLAALVREVADDADFEARSVNRSVQVVSSDDCSINGVEELLRSAVENVVRNAVRYTPEGTAVEVALRKQNGGSDNFAVISVRDRGNGVPEEALERIFRPFYRTEDARDRQSGGGTGLGLAITERAVRMHGGSVQAVNAVDGGLAVEMRLSLNGIN
ncbi:MAG TPA: ATP-binding protein [Pyrinomonadaceae bacterium]|jgi:two-component system sensor histidine kinase CpxA|nr:ATP-binding protein [Pyrinomonadaceae bacterium]